VKDAVKQWLNGLVVELYDEGTQKLITYYVTRLNVGGNHVEK
jgi:hypothetical protein